MADSHKYTVVTPHGDVNLTTTKHHSLYTDLVAFLEAHKTEIATACNVSSLAVSGLTLYLSHGRAGAKLKT